MPFLQAYADNKFEVELVESAIVYQKPSLQSRQIGRAEVGRKYHAHPRVRNGFYAIRFPYRGRWRVGYISQSAVHASAFRRQKKRIFSRYTAGFSGVWSRHSQASRTLETAPETTYGISQFTGQAVFGRIFADLPLEDKWVTRFALVARKTIMQGQASVQGGNSYSKLELVQQFIGVEVQLRKYVWADAFWVSGSLEASKSLSLKIKTLEGTPISDEGVEKPFYATVAGSAGYDLQWRHFFVSPEVRYGLVVTTEPFVNLIEGLLNVGYAF